MSFEKENNHFVCDHGGLDAAHFFPIFSKWNTDNRAQYNLCREGGEYSNAIVHAFQKFRAPFSGKIVHIFPEQSAVI